MQITVPSTTYAVYDVNGAELTYAATSINSPYALGFNWFASSKVLELTLPPYKPLGYDYKSTAFDHTSIEGSWSTLANYSSLYNFGTPNCLLGQAWGTGGTADSTAYKVRYEMKASTCYL